MDEKTKEKIGEFLGTIFVVIVILSGIGNTIKWIQEPTTNEKELIRENFSNALVGILDNIRPIDNIIEEGGRLGDKNKMSIRGQAFIWYLENNEICTTVYSNIMGEKGICFYLYENGSIIPQNWDIEHLGMLNIKENTFFLVKSQKLERMGIYENTQMSAYRGKFYIYVVYLPEKRVIGMHTIISDPPELVSYYNGTYIGGENIGDTRDVSDWVKNLPRDDI